MNPAVRDSVLDIFSRVSVFQRFTRAEIHQRFFGQGFARIIEFEPGEQIIDEGRFDNWVFWLIAGTVDVVKGTCTVATLQRAGDMFGELGVLQGDVRSATVRACTTTICLAIDMSILEHPDLAGKVDRDAFCRDVAFVAGGRLASTTSRLTAAEQDLHALREKLDETRAQLEETRQQLHATRHVLMKTLERLEDKDVRIRDLETQAACGPGSGPPES